MRYIPRALLAGGLGFAAAVLAACGGGSGLLSAGQSSTLNSQLDAVSAAIARGHCTAAAATAQGFDNSVANLTSINPTLTDNLRQASAALAQRAGPECSSRQSSTTPATTKTKTTPTVTTPTSSTPTSTAPATTSTGATTPTTPATTPTPTGTTPTTPTTGGAGVGGTGAATGPSGAATPGSGH